MPAITEKHAYELLSRAYVSAVASKACAYLGISDSAICHRMTINGDEFDYGIDGRLRYFDEEDGIPYPRGIGFDFQLKATTRWKKTKGHIVYDIKQDAYNKIVLQNRHTGEDRCALILLCLHGGIINSVDISEKCCSIKKSAYWAILNGNTTTKGQIRIKIPTSNLFDENALTSLLDLAQRRAL